jgi:hypothetical protein
MVGAGAHSGLSHLGMQTKGMYKLFMSEMESSLIDGLCKLIREEICKNA